MQQHAFAFYNLYFTSMDKPHSCTFLNSCVKKTQQNRTGLKPEHQITETLLGCIICSTVAVQVAHIPKRKRIHRPYRMQAAEVPQALSLKMVGY